MTEILDNIVRNPDAFQQSTFDSVDDSITKSWTLKFLGLSQENNGKHEQLQIVCSLFYHLIDEFHSKGCTRSEICALSRLSATLWNESLGSCLSSGLHSLADAALEAAAAGASERAIGIFVEYSTVSFLQHFHLYKACLADSKREIRFKRIATVEAPTAPPPLKEGRTPEEHRYFERLREIEVEEELERRRASACQSGELAQIQRRRQGVEAVEPPIEKEQREALISDLIDMSVKAESVKLSGLLDSSNVDLTFKAKRTALARPASLGPPPRFTVERKSASSTRSSAKSREAKRKK